MKFYTSVFVNRGKINLRGYDNGKRIKKSIHYKPYLFVNSNDKNEKYKNHLGQPVSRIDFGSTSEAWQFIQQYENVDNFPIYGLTNWSYLFLNDTYPGQVEFDTEKIKVAYLDIEVAADQGFPSVDLATKEITAISFKVNNTNLVFGCGAFESDDINIVYHKCKNEIELLQRFIVAWQNADHDIISGWNIEGFDIPYLYNRINNVLGEGEALLLSPWNVVKIKDVIAPSGLTYKKVNIEGIAVLDYLQLYKKFSYTNQESYRLDFIASQELGEKKIDYSEYDSLLGLYKHNFQKFIEYNIKDVELVQRLDEKLKFIDLVLVLAYDAKINYNDALTTVLMWDVIIHNYLRTKDIVIPPVKYEGRTQIAGGHVKDPQIGLHKWVVSFDLTSLYPMLIQQYNMSPETFAGSVPLQTIPEILDGGYDQYKQLMVDENVCITAKGIKYKRDFQGFLPKMMEYNFAKRAEYKKKMLEAKQKLENVDGLSKAQIEAIKNDIAKYNGYQQAIKIKLNSAYGATANPYFRWFTPTLAESITLTGQLTIQWAERRINNYLNKIVGNKKHKDYVIASDTDSLYLNMEDIVKLSFKNIPDDCSTVVAFLDNVCKQKIEPFLEKQFQELGVYVNAFKQKMKMKRECIANKGIWTAKKHYILNVYNQEGVQYREPKLKLQGIEAVRSSTPQVCRDKIKAAMVVILSKENDDLIEFIKQFRSEFNKMPFNDIAFPRSIKGLKKYHDQSKIYVKGTPIHVKGALLYNYLIDKNNIKKYQKVFDGDKIKFCWLITPNPINDTVISAPANLPNEFGLNKYLDYDKQFEKSFVEPLKTITNAIGWSTKKENTLDRFFV